ncbi:hypothetical protein BLNAU_23565 [Blattamonas nauphoetae]|uniref:Uncharacterized protein n=1 Tax=Blattamonas nauphoetae TaxID=2049346 RepID=A0ABQ9WU17_9EUKA|nr:hypothetical protein BLNAU_23565 [Blattamonas nauphoetae]
MPIVFGGSTLKYGSLYSVVSLTSSSLHCLLAGPITFSTPAAPARIKTASCSLVGESERSCEVVLSGEALPAGTSFSISLDEIDENGDVIADTTPISLSDKFGGEIDDSALTTHTLSITLFPVPQLMKYSGRYRITSLSISSAPTAPTAVEQTATFNVPAEPARIVGIWGKLDASGNTTSITLCGRQIARGSYTVKLNSESGPSFPISFSGEMSDETNSSVASVPIFGDSPVLSFGVTYTLFSVTPTSSPSTSLLIDASPNSFVISEPTRLISVSPLLSATLETVTLTLGGRCFDVGDYSVKLQLTSPSPGTPFEVACSAVSETELEVTLPISSSDASSVEFGDVLSVLSLKNESSSAILDISTFSIPHPPRVDNASFSFCSDLNTTFSVTLCGTDLPSHERFLVVLDSNHSFEIEFSKGDFGTSVEMALGWEDTLEYNTEYGIVSITNEESGRVVFVGSSLSFRTGKRPKKIVVFFDSSSLDCSRLCGSEDSPCSSMDSAWMIASNVGALDISLRLILNATLSSPIVCLLNGIVVVEKEHRRNRH